MKVPFTIHADFESLIVPIQTCSPVSGGLHLINERNIHDRINPPVSATSYEGFLQVSPNLFRLV